MAWRDLILRDFWLKLFSLAMAVLIWFTVNELIHETKPADPVVESLTQKKIPHLPVTLMMGAADGRGFQVVPAEVAVTVSARTGTLQRLTPADFHTYVDLTDFRDTEGIVKKIHVIAPDKVTVLRVEPEIARVERVNAPAPVPPSPTFKP